MKKATFACALMIVSTFGTESQSIPKLKLLYPEPTGTVFDHTCGQLLHTEINPEWEREAARRLPEFQAA